MKKIIEWVRRRDGFELALLGGIGFILGLLVVTLTLDSNEKAEFMDECKEYRPKFECTAMWRSGEKSVRVQ